MPTAGRHGSLQSADPLTLAADRLAALRASLQTRVGTPVRLIETHISWVLLAGHLAYKFKKPVKLAFLDFSTLAARRRFCEEEVRINQRLAPSLYLGLVDVCEGSDGPAFGGTDTVVDVAVRMERFPDGALWSERLAAGRLAPHHVDAMAQTLADFHRDAAVAPGDGEPGSPASQHRVTQGVIDAIDAIDADRRHAKMQSGPDAPIDWPALRDWLHRQQQTLAPLRAARRRAGRIRECHGDLHLANVVQIDGSETGFDGIEFDDALRWIDVLDDMAFLAMDLVANGRRDLGFRFINAYLAASGDYEGLPMLRFYMVGRALVRARVMAISPGHGTHTAAACSTEAYLALACSLARGGGARLAITHGLPGAGKSFVAQGVVEAAGAIAVRSDVERKRLFGLQALESSRDQVPGGIYGTADSSRTYARLRDIAAVALAAGWPVVVDAAFLMQAERAQFVALAASMSVPLSIFDCRATLPTLRRRLASRQAGGTDPSEADAAVLERLTQVAEPLGAVEQASAFAINAGQPLPPETLTDRWLAVVRHRIVE